jgi:hypothetical protein
LAWAVYSPALNRVFASINPLPAELDGRTSLADGLRHYDYATGGIGRRRCPSGRCLHLAGGGQSVARITTSGGTSIWPSVLVALVLFRLLIIVGPSPLAPLQRRCFWC